MENTKSEEQVILEELQGDEYGFDLRNWDEQGITEETIRQRYEVCDKENKGFPVVSASRYFTFLLPILKTHLKTPAEIIVKKILEAREENWYRLKKHWEKDMKVGLRIYFERKDERDLEWPRNCYQEYERYCRALGLTPVTKKTFYLQVKAEVLDEKKKGGELNGRDNL